MPKFRDYYAVLAVSSSASFAEIRSAYHKLALKYHPDHNPGDSAAEGRFKEISEAYAGLSSPQKRHTYDRLWGKLRHGQELVFPHGAGGNPAGGFSDFFHSLFGRASGAGPGVTPAWSGETDIELHLSLAEALNGSRQVLSVCLKSACPACAGAGLLRAGPCPQCGGAGQAVELEKVEVKLPEGLRDGDRLSLNGLSFAMPGRGGGHYLKIHVSPHPDFKVSGDDLETELRLAPGAADPGGEVPVPAPDGFFKLRLPRGWRPGARLRVRGRGLRKKDGTRGDLLVLISAAGDTAANTGQNRKRGGLWS
jgi:curved DNA-binding protein